jgi:hypothetical protein
MRRFTALFVSLLAFGAVAVAQIEPKPLEVPKTEFYIGYAYQRADTSGSTIQNDVDLRGGFAFEFSRYLHNHNFGLTVDLARESNSSVNSTGIKYERASYMAGPTYRFHNIGFFAVNVHALAGVDHDIFNVPENNTILTYTSTAVAAAVGAAIDGNLSRHIGIRVAQVDCLYTNHYNTNQGSFRYTGGVVARF